MKISSPLQLELDELETDKAPHRKGFADRKNNPTEGNPDFENDAARLYVSMQTKADDQFGLILNTEGQDADSALALPDLSGEGTINRSHVVGKADHIRFVARNSEDPAIKGTVLLAREGQPNEDLGYFYIDEDGLIQIESEKIYMGEGTGETEPNVMYTNYEATITALQTQIDTLTSMVETAFAAAKGNIGASIPGLVEVGGGATITAAIAANKAKVEANTKTDQHSLKIFNEPNPNRS